VEGEIAARDASKDRKRLRSQGTGSVMEIHRGSERPKTSQSYSSNHEPSSMKTHYSLHSHDYPFDTNQIALTPLSEDKTGTEEYPLDELPQVLPFRPNRKRGEDVELGGIGLTEANLSKHDLHASVNPMVHSFTSPIDMVYVGGNARSEASRLTFTRR